MTDVTREHGFEPLRVQGRVPEALRGTLVRNGPGLMSLFGRPYGHWFDGDGLLAAVRFADGRASGAVRLLETAGLLEERQRGKPYFGSYGTSPPGPFNPLRAFRFARGSTKNPANTSVMAWNQRLFALCEIGRPFEVDPDTLASRGETDLAGVVPRGFSAHPHRLAHNGCIYNVGVRIGRPNALDVFLLRPDGTAGRVTTLPLEHPTMIHDFALTPRALVVFVAPLRLALLPTLLGRGAFADNLHWEPERGTEVIVIPLDAPASPVRFPVESFWAWHVGNAFERGDEIVIDLVRYRDFPSTAAWLGGVARGDVQVDADGLLERAVLDPSRRRMRFERLRERTGEFPRVAPAVEGARHGSVYWLEHFDASIGRDGPPDTVVRVDVETGAHDAFRFEAHELPSEAVFAPRSEQDDDGWLVTLVYDARSHTSHWAVLDAAHLADGPVARAHLDHHVPLGFHGVWTPHA
jgi:all-trans-8'-apo-beta-carotenal 15,15'-oxygenase